MSILDPLYRYDPAVEIKPAADSAAIHRIARRIFSRHLNEGNPIDWQQAKADAERAWSDVNAMANERKVAS